MTNDLIKESGKFRSGNVGVYNGTILIHPDARPQFVSQLISDSHTAVENNIRKLKEMQILGRIGSNKSGNWVILDRFDKIDSCMAIYTTARNYFQEGGTLDTTTDTNSKTYGWGKKSGGDWSKRRNATTISPNGRRIPLDIDDVIAN